MRSVYARARLAITLTLCGFGCNGDGALDAEPRREVTPPPEQPDAGPSAECTVPSGCVDIDVGGLVSTACCSPVTSCGYLLAELDEETLMLFPQATEFYAKVTAGDPNGRCAPESFFFGPRPGGYAQRWEGDVGDDILVTPDCTSYTIGPFILPGCCLRDNTCGLSTHASGSSLGPFAEDENAPFAKSECVPAEVLNEQLRDSKLKVFARTTTQGSCDYAQLDATLEKWF